MAKLVCQSGPTAGHEYPLDKDLISMGRQGTCEVQIMDTMSSRVHCQVRKDGKLFSLVDLGSRNGTYLNGKKVTERQLAFGDRIQVGEAEYLLVKEAGDVELKDLLSKYEIQEKIGEGGMGIVYKANQRSMARSVALKILSPKYATKPRFVDQFIREARAAGQLNHPNIIQVHDVGTENGIHYFSMEFVDGPTCMQVLRQNGTFPTGEALEIVRQTANALEYAHKQRLIHQDIKPDNIMLAANSMVKLADLGISKTFDEVEAEAGTKRVMGTPHYMAPEAALGKKIDHRVDIYGLGATLYHLLTNKTPYAGTSATEVLKAHVMDPMPAIQDFNPSVPDEVTALVERMMAKKPDDRYSSAGEIAIEIKRLQAGHKLGVERIASSETMILQKLARGASGTAGTTAGATSPTPAATTGNRVAGRHGHGTTDHRQRHGPATSRLRVVILAGIAAVVLFTIGLLVPKFLPTTPEKPIAITPPVEIVPSPPVVVKPPTVAPPDDRESRAQADALKALEDRVKMGGANLDHQAVLATLDDLESDGLAPANKPRAAALRQQVENLLQKRQAAIRDQAFSDLHSEVAKLTSDEERNYDLALSRIAAFPYAKDQDTAAKVAALHDEYAKKRDDYLADLKTKVQLLANQKNSPRLRELRDKLPKSMIGSAIEQDIVKALKVIDDEIRVEQQTVLSQAAKHLANWKLVELESLHGVSRPEMGDTTSGRQFDQYLQTSNKLSELIKALDAGLKDHEVRFHGTLQTWSDTDLIGADSKSLHCRIQHGAFVDVYWKDIEPGVVSDIATLVLHDQAAQYKPALDMLAALRGAPVK